jgi:micrococcal nuclease
MRQHLGGILLHALGIQLMPFIVVSMSLTASAEGIADAATCGGLPAHPVSVMRCYDGDTCTLADKTKVRLAGIDAPEKKGTMGGTGQSGSEAAAVALRERLVGKTGITMSIHDRDRYGRTVGEFCVDGRSVNVDMVREGVATVYRGKVKKKTIDMAALDTAENEAKVERKGLWADGAVQDPSDYRKKLRDSKQNYAH